MRIQLVEFEDLNVGVAQLGHQLFAPEAIDLGNDACDFVADQLELLARRSAVHADLSGPGLNLLPEAGHANHEEFVDIRPENGHELHAFEQRRSAIFGLFQHAPLKREQA